MSCDLNACKTCTGCAHSRHDKCRHWITCPNTGEVFLCRCCGDPLTPLPDAA